MPILVTFWSLFFLQWGVAEMSAIDPRFELSSSFSVFSGLEHSSTPSFPTDSQTNSPIKATLIEANHKAIYATPEPISILRSVSLPTNLGGETTVPLKPTAVNNDKSSLLLQTPIVFQPTVPLFVEKLSHTTGGKRNITEKASSSFSPTVSNVIAKIKLPDKKRKQSSTAPTWIDTESVQKDVPIKTPNESVWKPKPIEELEVKTERTPIKFLRPYIHFIPHRNPGATESVNAPQKSGIYTEIIPDWHSAKPVWGHWWNAHIYFFGILFIFLSLVSIAGLLGILRSAHYYLLVSNLCLASFSSLRAAYLLGDAYNIGGSYPPILWNILSSLAWACLSSSLCVTIIIIINETHIGTCLKHPILFFVGSLFSFSLLSSMVAGVYHSASFVLLINQLLFPIWTWIVALGYVCLYSKLHRSALKKQGEYIRSTLTKLHIEGAQLPRRIPQLKLTFTIKLLYLGIINALVISVIQIIGIFLYTTLLTEGKVEPWPWLAFQTLSRVIEVSLTGILFYISLSYFVRHHWEGEMESQSKSFKADQTMSRVYPETVNLNDVSIPLSSGNILNSLASSSNSRPSSMLYNENGFIRFRTERDPPQDILPNDEVEEVTSTRATAGSSLQTLFDGTVSPFLRSLSHSRYTRCSTETVDVSSDQLSHVTDNKRYGSTCSSESAANSFDVTFFLHGTPRQRPAFYSISPRRADPGLRLDLKTTSEKIQCGGGTDDITPDSAVYVDLPQEPDSNLLRRGSCTSVATPRFLARNLLKKIRGSSFSLNANLQGYELLIAEKASSCQRPSSAQEKFRLSARNSSHGHLRDSGLIHDCNQHVMTDQASQTEPDNATTNPWSYKLSVLCQTDS